MPRTAANAARVRNDEIRASGLAGRLLADTYGLSVAQVARIRSAAPRVRTKRERFELEVVGGGWAAACMESDEWQLWLSSNPRIAEAGFADRPCQDCPLGFAAEMRAIGRCNGSPGAVGGRHEPDDDEEGEGHAMLNQNERSSGGVRGIPLDLVPPPCETCLHEPICVLRLALEKTRQADVAVAPLPDGLSVVVTAKVDCRFYTGTKKPRVANQASGGLGWTPERRAAQSERLKAFNAAKAGAES